MSELVRAAFPEANPTAVSQICTQTTDTPTNVKYPNQKAAANTISNGSIKIVRSCANAEGDLNATAESK